MRCNVQQRCNLLSGKLVVHYLALLNCLPLCVCPLLLQLPHARTPVVSIRTPYKVGL